MALKLDSWCGLRFLTLDYLELDFPPTRQLSPHQESRIFFYHFSWDLLKPKKHWKMEQLPCTFYINRPTHFKEFTHSEEKENNSKAGGNFPFYFSFWMTIFVLEGLCVCQIGSSVCGHIWPERSCLNPANSWNDSIGILGLTETAAMAGASLMAGTEKPLITPDKGHPGCMETKTLSSALWE